MVSINVTNQVIMIRIRCCFLFLVSLFTAFLRACLLLPVFKNGAYHLKCTTVAMFKCSVHAHC